MYHQYAILIQDITTQGVERKQNKTKQNTDILFEKSDNLIGNIYNNQRKLSIIVYLSKIVFLTLEFYKAWCEIKGKFKNKIQLQKCHALQSNLINNTIENHKSFQNITLTLDPKTLLCLMWVKSFYLFISKSESHLPSNMVCNFVSNKDYSKWHETLFPAICLSVPWAV